MTRNLHIAIIGGGASGLMAAIMAARAGARVTILERADRVGKRILATGNGRCNLSNINAAVNHYHGENPGFAAPALQVFSVEKTREFFDGLGCGTIVEDDGKVYPLTLQASTVLDVLRFEVERCGCTVLSDSEVTEIVNNEKGFQIHLSKSSHSVDRVVVAAGGKAAPQLGGNDSGMYFLESFGHTICPTYPALVPLKTDCSFLKQIKGTKIDAVLELSAKGKRLLVENGELLFTDYGFSGPPIIQLSLAANRALNRDEHVKISLDLFPEWTLEQLKKNLRDRFTARPDDPLEKALIGFIHKKLIPAVIDGAGIAVSNIPSSQMGSKEIDRLASFVKRWTSSVLGSLPWRDAQLMAGGISTEDFSAETMESALVPGLYACGEVLDIAGDCGGYNLQWAWSSGYLAGIHAARI